MTKRAGALSASMKGLSRLPSPMMSKPVPASPAQKGNEFLQGFAVALASANRSFDLPTLVKSVMEGFGVSVKLLKDAGVEDYDLKEIRKCMK